MDKRERATGNSPRWGAAGGSETLTVTLQSGKYQFYCSVPSHKQLGMLDTVTVA